MVFLFKMII